MSRLRLRLSFSCRSGMAGLGQQTTTYISLVARYPASYCGIRAGLCWAYGWIDLMIGSWSIRQV